MSLAGTQDVDVRLDEVALGRVGLNLQAKVLRVGAKEKHGENRVWLHQRLNPRKHDAL